MAAITLPLSIHSTLRFIVVSPTLRQCTLSQWVVKHNFEETLGCAMTTVWNKWYPLPHGRMLHVFGDAREFDYKLLRGHSAPIAKWVNTMAACTLGVYLIHDNPFVRPCLWKELLNGCVMPGGGCFFMRCIIIVLAVYAVCTLIALVWKWTVERCYIRAVEPRLLPRLQRLGGKLADLLEQIFNRCIDRA